MGIIADRDGHPDPRAMSADPDVFNACLEESDSNYIELCGDPDLQQVHIRFTGRLQGVTVVWNCQIVTLKEEARRLAERGAGEVTLKRFIEIGKPAETGMPLRVGLNVRQIDAPVIRKTIIMIRNYKNLQPGRHEYGEACPVVV